MCDSAREHGHTGHQRSGSFLLASSRFSLTPSFLRADPKVFTFDAVADEHSTQEEIFAVVGKHITESCMAGTLTSAFHNSCTRCSSLTEGHRIQREHLRVRTDRFGQDTHHTRYDAGVSIQVHVHSLTLVLAGATTPNGELIPGMKGLIPRVLDHMYYLVDQNEKAVRICSCLL